MATDKKSLAETHPEIATLASGWDPALFTAGSHKKVLWKCSIGHQWEATIGNLVRTGNCPYCNGSRILKGFNDLQTTHPGLAEEAFGWDPSEYRPGSGRRLQWRCKKGHVWTTTIFARTSGGGCGICSGRFVEKGVNDLLTKYPELAEEAVGWDPQKYSAGSGEKVRWKCGFGHEWNAVISSRALRGSGCGTCSGRQTLTGFNDLATEFPDLANEILNQDPKLIFARSPKNFDWMCKKGHIWSASVVNRSRLKSGCPYCAGQKVIVGETDLTTTHPEMAAEAIDWNPEEYSIGSGVPLEWECKEGHRWIAKPNKRKRGDGCTICSGHQLSAGDNDLLTTDPELAKQANGWDPSTVTRSHNGKKSWQCQFGHVWLAVVGSRATGVGCPTCSGKVVQVGFNDLKTLNPLLAKQASGWNPEEVTIGSSRSMLWECDLGHRWKATIGNRARTLHCPTCINKIVLTGFNDLATTHPEIATQAVAWDPTSFTAGSTASKKEWVCDQGHHWKARIAQRAVGHGCPTCAKTGFDPNSKAWLYFAEHDGLGLLQIGISNQIEKRLTTHAKYGWEVIEIRGPMNGGVTQEWESSILRMLKIRGAVFGGTKSMPGQNRFTLESSNSYGSESWIKESCPIVSILQLMTWVEEDEEQKKSKKK